MAKQLNYETADIRVLMLGAARVGKTSILASMSDATFLSRATAGSNLEIVVNEEGGFGNIIAARDTMAKYFDPNQPADPNNQSGPKRDVWTRLTLDDSKSMGRLDFSMLLKTKRSKATYSIGFTDIPGEWVNNCNGGLDDATKTQLQNLVKMADVIIVTVDSVLLMESGGIYCRDGNKIDNVTSLIKQFCKGSEGNAYKMVLFVPVKCERYYHRHLKYVENPKLYDEDPMVELIGCVKKEYSELMAYFDSAAERPFINVGILPIITLGNIEFKAFKSGATGVRTAKDMLFGYYANISDENPTASIPNYAPTFCEQPLIYILLFELAKIKKTAENKSFAVKIAEIFRKIFLRMASDSEFIAEIKEISKNAILEDYISDIVQQPLPIISSK